MTSLLRATTLIGRPVVTLDGESPLEIKDVVFNTTSGEILGFTLRKHGILGSPASEVLRWSAVHGLGPDAVVVADVESLSDDAEDSLGDGGDVLGNRIMTESGTDLGEVVEVVVATGRHAEVVGFEVEAAGGSRSADDHHVFIPLLDTLAISGKKIIVPDAATDFIRDDLSGFGSAVAEFRSTLSGKAN
ncbi:MAG: PRC-barrel domain-containing protein [Acidimicrobiales bacterium]